MPAPIVLPDKAIFNARAQAIGGNIEAITKRNKMAKLLVSNFRGWVESSAMSPLDLTLELDKDKNGLISGDEFSTLLAKMTGERPPEWVTELMFSFTGASPDVGIALGEWLAMLAALGLDIPEELFEVKTPVTGTIVLTSSPPHLVDEGVKFRFDFSEQVDAYLLSTIQHSNGAKEEMPVGADNMDGATFDTMTLTPDEIGDYTLELMHLGVRLDTIRLTVVEPPVEPKRAPVKSDPTPVLAPESHKEVAPVVGAPGLKGLVEALELTKLRSEASSMAAASGPMTLQGIVTGKETTLLGPHGYRPSVTLVVQGNGFTVEVMMKTADSHHDISTPVELTVQPHDWSLARRRMIALEA